MKLLQASNLYLNLAFGLTSNLKNAISRYPVPDELHFLPGEKDPVVLSQDLDVNVQRLQAVLGNSSDLVVRRFTVGPGSVGIRCALAFIDGMVERESIRTSLLNPLIIETQKTGFTKGLNRQNAFDRIWNTAVLIGEIKEDRTLQDVLRTLLAGNTSLLVDGSDRAISANTKGFEVRPVGEPMIETVVRGPREGFTEAIRVNTALLRRRLQDPNLRLERFQVGRRTQTGVTIAYLQGVANPKVVEEVRRRVRRIDIDGALESSYIEELINDTPHSIFATVGRTERPDTLVAKLLEGRVGIFVDGTPFVLTVPHLFIEELQSPEDYYTNPIYSSLIRLIRLVAFFTAVFLPSFWVAVTTFHPEFFPTPFLLTIAAGREGVSFPTAVEALLMGLIFEGLREAGIRLPRPVGQAISIVGALIIGTAAVDAGLVTAPMVIVVAAAGIATFLMPTIDVGFVTTLLRLPTLFLGATLGLYGILLVGVVIMVHLASLRSFGVPYLSPLAPLSVPETKDVLVRTPLWSRPLRPRVIGYKEPRRQKDNTLPHPPRKVGNRRGEKTGRDGSP